MIDRAVAFLAKMPSTNLRIFVSVCLATIYVMGAMGMNLVDRPVPEATLIVLGSFLLAMMGLDVAQFSVKRATHMPSPPAQPDVEDAKAIEDGP